MKKILMLTLFLTGCVSTPGTNLPAIPSNVPVPTSSPSPMVSSSPTAQSCTVVKVTEGAKIICPDGTTQTITDGEDGLNGTVVTPIQFCPGAVANYPTTFPEYGLLINKQVFAVYSAKDGFLAVRLLGTYQSNAINSSCTFTVNADGTITQE